MAVVLGTAIGHAQPPAPWFGTWEQVLPAPGRLETPRYKRITLRIEPSGDGLHVIYDMVRARGGIDHVEWTGRFDGRDYPVQGVDSALTNAYSRIDERSYAIVLKVDGQTVARATAAVSADGQTLTVVTESPGQARSVATYQRRS
jgi:hypothetical protein